jgi:hypothetical protein
MTQLQDTLRKCLVVPEEVAAFLGPDAINRVKSWFDGAEGLTKDEENRVAIQFFGTTTPRVAFS